MKHEQVVPDRNHALNVIAGELSDLYGWLLFTTRYGAAHEALAVVERRLGLPVGNDPVPSSTNGRPVAPGPDRALELLRELVAMHRDGTFEQHVRPDLWARARALVEDEDRG